MAYSIIKKHDGEIKVESEVGKGTTFVIRLPVEGTKEGDTSDTG
jgi:signal transduction histidine kinase